MAKSRIIKVGTAELPATTEDIKDALDGIVKKWWIMRGDTDADYIGIVHAKTEDKAIDLAHREYGNPDDPNHEIWIKPWFRRGEEPKPKPALLGSWDPRVFFDGKVVARGDSIRATPLGLVVRFPMVFGPRFSWDPSWVKALFNSTSKPIAISHTMGPHASMKYVGCKAMEIKIIASPDERIVLEALMSYEGAVEGGPLTSSFEDLGPARVMIWEDFGTIVDVLGGTNHEGLRVRAQDSQVRREAPALGQATEDEGVRRHGALEPGHDVRQVPVAEVEGVQGGDGREGPFG